MGQVTDRMFDASGDIQLTSDRFGAIGNRHETYRGVFDIVEIPRGGQTAQFDLGLTRKQLGNDSRDNGTLL